MASTSTHSPTVQYASEDYFPVLDVGPTDQDSNVHDDNSELDALLFENSLQSFFAKIYANPLTTRSVIQTVAEEFKVFLLNYNNVLKSLVEQENIEFHNTLTAFSDKISSLSTEHQRFSTFSAGGTLILPEEIVIGSRMEYSQSKQLVQKNCTMQLVHLKPVLEQLFSLPNILTDTVQYMSSLCHSSSPIENVIQGQAWKKMQTKFKKGPNMLNFPLVLYFDDFETNNPLSSHNSIQKLGGVYVSLPVLPKKYFSKLENIFLLALFHAADRTKFGNRIIFQKIIEELNNLSHTGISASLNNTKIEIRFHVITITGDNLGLNSILGFVESFTANYCCRICNASKLDISKMFCEDVNILRNMDSYREQLVLKSPSDTGIKEECTFLQLNNFNLFENVAVDLLHDFLEGVCRYVMDFVMNYLISDAKLVSLDILQLKIANFHYGPDRSSKPVNALFKSGTQIRVKTTASEMLTLVRYFGLMAGSFVPSKDRVWELFLLLRKLLNELFTHRVYEENFIPLIETIQDFNKLYYSLAKTNLKPKFHFLLHYPQMLKRFGPLTQIWAMRFEGKHRVFKIAARSSNNKINICKTTALRNQLNLNNMFFQGKGFNFLSVGKKKALKLLEMQPLIDANIMNSSFVGLNFNVPFVTVDGISFHIGDIVLVDIAFHVEDFKFCLIESIFIENNTNEISFLCMKLDCLGFDFHSYAHEVEFTNTRLLLMRKQLFSPVMPHTLTILSDSRKMITLRINVG
ncbi:hypothetical protein WDU94_005541 [Cyamophila willieti]